MRTVHVNLEKVLPALDTGKSKFAMWINSPLADVPRTLQMEVKNDMMSIFILYNRQYESVSAEVAKGYIIYRAMGSPKITGFQFPAKEFRTAPRGFIEAMNEMANDMNSEPERFNYRCVAKIIEMHEDQLFLPGQ